MKGYTTYKGRRLPAKLFLMICQVFLASYIINDFIFKKPFELHDATPAQLRWFYWMNVEVAMTVSSILGCMIYLLLRACKVEM